MRIHLRDPSLLGELRQHFSRAGYVVELEGQDAVYVRAPEGVDPKQAAEEMRLLLMLWHAMHPGATIEPPA